MKSHFSSPLIALPTNEGINDSNKNNSFIIFASLPSYGNIGQMALDCLLSSLTTQNKIEHIGYCTSDYLFPMCGYEQFTVNSKKTLCLPIEVYRIINTNYILVQQRSPCFPHSIKEYCQEFLQFLESLNPHQIFMLCGSTTLGLSDEILQSNRFFLYGNPILEQFPQYSIALKQFQFAHCPWPPPPPPSSSVAAVSAVAADSHSFETEQHEEIVDGSPLVSQMIQILVETNQTEEKKITFLGRFCNEGNNLGDSIDLVAFLVSSFQLFDLSSHRLTFPTSWNNLFGPPLDDNSMF